MAAAAGVINGSAALVAGGVNWTTPVSGISHDYLEVRDWPLTEGRTFTPQEIRSDAKVVILGATVAKDLSGGAPAIGGGGTIAMALLGSWPVAITPSLILVALASSAAVGVFFGYYPARAASRMNPIDALRYE